MVRIHLEGGQIHEGKIYAIDPVTYSIILSIEDEEGSYVLINSTQIIEIEGDLNAATIPNVAALGMSTVKAIQRREQEYIVTSEKGIAALNFQVDPKVQALFDSFNKTLPCHWEDNNMIILEAYIIASPDYSIVTPLSDQDSALKRLEKMLEVERSKLGF